MFIYIFCFESGFIKEIVRGRYDEGDFILPRNQRDKFCETDEKSILSSTRTAEEICKDYKETSKSNWHIFIM